MWSVLIPTFRPNPEFLRAAIASVLAQGIDSADLQVRVVDDATPDRDVEDLVRQCGAGRVEFARNPRTLGLAGNWNACVTQARGKWIHLLHQDDLVFPGFYREMQQLIAGCPDAGAACSRHCFIDDQAGRTLLSEREAAVAGLLADWQFRETATQRIQCAAIVVRRSVYTELGGFRTDLPYCLDWEMWARIAARYPFAYSPRVLAAYRRHAKSETDRLLRTPIVVLDRIRTFEMLAARLPADRVAAATDAFVHELMSTVMHLVPTWYAQGRFDDVRAVIDAMSDLPVPRARRQELTWISRKMWLKKLARRLRPTRTNRVPETKATTAEQERPTTP